ncbi:hypothetical protein HZS_7542 [Henneguya salminicola]|nr:hypothetical protein HZS_7542 [Henneguya salminicola]
MMTKPPYVNLSDRLSMMQKLKKIYTVSQDCFLLFDMLNSGNALNLIKEKIQKNINFEPFQAYFNETWMQKFPPNLNLWNNSELKE